MTNGQRIQGIIDKISSPCDFRALAKKFTHIFKDDEVTFWYFKEKIMDMRSRAADQTTVDLLNNALDYSDILVERSRPKKPGQKKKTLKIDKIDNLDITMNRACTMKEIEREVIRIALERNNHSRRAAARELGLALRTIRNKLNEYTKEKKQ